MAAKSNSGFDYDDMNSALNQHAISFQFGDGMSSLSEMVPMSNYFGLKNGSSGMMYSVNSSTINNNPMIAEACSTRGSSLVHDSVPGLKHDAGLAVEWSVDEQYKLEESLVQYADEPSILKYIKIAASLRDKTVRDVALRCRWMTRKRRKQEEKNLVKKFNNRKDKPVESSPKQYLQSALPPSMATYSCMPHHIDKSHRILYDGICGPVKQLLELNAQVLNQINANLCTYKLQDNIDLFGHTRNNINTILNDMTQMPGIMSQMPQLPVSIDEDLVANW
ncbi:PREDICTED: uncharacterized protein LOC109360388 isoform X2 [Lupinus angustifolius]|uniref:uncharacterized protein LOC109360388 isoform X2 n=1 Tax=Lupinus angustifolius TaxID=3871 RepID=UPI00092F6265|nr:PREDICTED: uncharacterized protein LOC109360388 isoform X2 [Lupinus angustifolius]